MKPIQIIILLFLFLVIKTGVSQNDYHWDWVKQIHGEYFREFDYAIDNNDNIYVTGKFHGHLSIGDTLIQSPFYEYSYWSFLAKYDWKGDFQWVKVISTDTNLQQVLSTFIELDEDNNIYWAGRHQGKIVLDDVTISNPFNDFWCGAYLIKLDENGEILWNTQVYGNSGGDYFSAFKLDYDRLIYTSQHGSREEDGIIVVGKQDTIITTRNGTCFVIASFTLDGQIDWIETAYSDQSPRINEVIIDNNRDIYLCGLSAKDSIFLEFDTIYSSYPSIMGYNFLLKYSITGHYIQSNVFSDFPISWFSEGPNSTILVAGDLYENIIINNDTLTLLNPGLYRNHIIGLFDFNLNPIWCNQVYAIPTSGALPIVIHSSPDSLVKSMVYYIDTCIVEDSVFINKYKTSYVYINYNSNGVLLSADNLVNTESSCSHKKFIPDDCGNIIHSGHFNNNAIFNKDTIQAIPSEYNSFIGRLNHHPLSFNLGQDTIVCDSYILSTNENFKHYSWNDNISNQSFLEITETGHYWLYAMIDYCCTGIDSIFISVLNSPVFDLGVDTSITIRDTLHLSIQEEFDSYLWQDSSTNNYFDIYGSKYLPGTYDFWVKVNNGQCHSIDTISVTIIDNSYLTEQDVRLNLINIYPVPVKDQLFIEYNIKKESEVIIAIYTVYGKLTQIKRFEQNNNTIDIFNLTNTNPGIYIIKIQLNGYQLNSKIIID